MTRVALVLFLAGCTSPISVYVPEPDAATDRPSAVPDAGAEAAVDTAPQDTVSPDTTPPSLDTAPPDTAAGFPDTAIPDAPPPTPDTALQPDTAPPDTRPTCAFDKIFCKETGRCHVPVLCFVEYTSGFTDLPKHLPLFCPAASGGRNAGEGVIDPNAWEAAPDSGSCDAVVARAAPDLCPPLPDGVRRVWLRVVRYDPADGRYRSYTQVMGPRCP